ncbi:hypothetical protein EV648_101264 [Kribbella sp. VKM Ac-2568]|nr:hypothetical protein EV648_101264 [Kribbella sp. VKM Ac-2568]
MTSWLGLCARRASSRCSTDEVPGSLCGKRVPRAPQGRPWGWSGGDVFREVFAGEGGGGGNEVGGGAFVDDAAAVVAGAGA